MRDIDQDRERIMDLLVERSDRPLAPAEVSELESLLAHYPDWKPEDFELAAAAMAIGELREETIPSLLRSRLQASVASPKLSVLAGQGRTPARDVAPPAVFAPAIPPRREFLGWMGAAAAAGLAAIGWWPRLTGRLAPVPPPPPPPLTLAQRRARLLAEAADAITLPFAVAADPWVKSVKGDLVWSASRQTGFMRFESGVPVNDPSQQQYQLWIFDAKRDDRYPVDGGVFDLKSGVEEIVEIVPKVRVAAPALFAVTLEPPGGVVVSSREHILVVAKPG